MTRYTVYVVPRAWQEIKNLPGNIRQQIKRMIESLANNPYPPKSKQLRIPDIEPDLYRIRLDRWRIIYAVTEDDRIIDVLAIRKRPPYDYGDLGILLKELL